jgi:hypothetical protein
LVEADTAVSAPPIGSDNGTLIQQFDESGQAPLHSANGGCVAGNSARCVASFGRLRTVEILPPGTDPTMIDATGNQVEEVNRDWCEAEAPALNNGLWSRPILDVTIHGKQALKATYPAEILDDSSNDLS